MLNIFRSYNPFNVIALFIVAIILKLGILINTETPDLIAGQIVWKEIAEWIMSIIGSTPLKLTFFSIANLVLQAIFLNRIVNRYELYSKPTYLPAYTYILLTSLVPDWNYFTPSLLVNWILIIIVNQLFKLYSVQDARKSILNISLLIGVASLVLIPNIFFILLLFICLGIIRPFKLKEWTIALLGLITVYYVFAALLYLSDSLPVLKSVMQVGISLPKSIIDWSLMSIVMGVLLLFSIVGLLNLKKNTDRMLMETRRQWLIIVFFFLVSTCIALFTDANKNSEWIFTMIPISLIGANTFMNKKGIWVGLFNLLIVGVVFFVQFGRKFIFL